MPDGPVHATLRESARYDAAGTSRWQWFSMARFAVDRVPPVRDNVGRAAIVALRRRCQCKIS